jgi:porphobilinogen synthase
MPPLSPTRPRRLRANPLLRNLVAATRLAPSDFILPLFIRAGKNIRNPIASMPGVFQLSPDTALEELRHFHALGGAACILFGITEPAHKTPAGDHALNPDNEVCTTLKTLKDAGLPLLAITDLCFCEYTDHGHCGPLTPAGTTVHNDPTIDQLGKQAVLHAQCGADIVAPSAAMDNMVHAIRSALDTANFPDTAILAYAVKYASAFYGPFRDAAESPPQFGDRKTYQMDFRRTEKEALHEAALDVEQGADLLMVKPGTPYLDILRSVAAASPVPTGTYHVSGEYAMIKAAATNNWIDEKAVVLETMHSFKRAGASFILTYYAAQLADWLNAG